MGRLTTSSTTTTSLEDPQLPERCSGLMEECILWVLQFCGFRVLGFCFFFFFVFLGCLVFWGFLGFLGFRGLGLGVPVGFRRLFAHARCGR